MSHPDHEEISDVASLLSEFKCIFSDVPSETNVETHDSQPFFNQHHVTIQIHLMQPETGDTELKSTRSKNQRPEHKKQQFGRLVSRFHLQNSEPSEPSDSSGDPAPPSMLADETKIFT